MRNNVHIRVAASLMTLWYCISIIGFDVHTCSASGRSFIATFVEGLSCQDIHPEHDCDEGHCCGHSHCGCSGADCEDSAGTLVRPVSCCTDDYQVLTLTGAGQDDGGYRLSDVQFLTFHHLVSEADLLSHTSGQGLISRQLPVLRHHSRDVRLSCNIWRI